MAKIYKANQKNQMINDIKKQVNKALADDVARRVYDIVQSYLLENIYNSYSPKTYTRTYELLRSLQVSPVFSNGSFSSIKIFIPEKQLSPDAHSMWYDIEQMGLSKGENPSASDIINILETGLNKYRGKTDVMQDVITELKATNVILKSLMSYLKSKGYKVI